MSGSTVAPPRPSWSAKTWLGGAAVAGWLVACDAWVKITARLAACDATPSVGDAASTVWSLPAGCGEAEFFGFARLSPVVRDGGPFGLGAGSLTGGAGQGWAIALIVLALVVTVLVLRWRWRFPGDATALGALWGAVVIEAGPRLLGDGTGLAELHLGGLATGLGDLALVWAVVWLSWRAIAEHRA